MVPELNEVIITEDIVKKLETLKIDRSPGPDSIHPRNLKELSDIIALPLCIIFNSYISSSVLPDIWKCTNVTAL